MKSTESVTVQTVQVRGRKGARPRDEGRAGRTGSAGRTPSPCPLSVHARPPLGALLGHVGAASGPGRWSWSESCSDGSLSLTRCSCVTPRLCFPWGSLTLWRSRRAGLSMLRSPRLTSGPPPRPHAAALISGGRRAGGPPKVSGKDQGVRDPGLSGERDPKINSH